jgi:hypothetical protein
MDENEIAAVVHDEQHRAGRRVAVVWIGALVIAFYLGVVMMGTVDAQARVVRTRKGLGGARHGWKRNIAHAA